MGVADKLYERSAEIAAIDSAVSALEAGRGSSLLLEARAGRGKSTLVEYAVEAGRAAGARTMLVRARHLTSAAPFEVLRRLLGPAVEDLGGADRLVGASRFARPLFTPGAELTHGVDYGCQWLVAWLAEQSPLVLAVDDAHWADSASLRVLLDVQAELSEQPVMLMLASRPVENPAVQSLLAAMGTHPDCRVLSPKTLTRDAVADLVVEELGQRLEDAFVDECLRISGGNAFYLHELMRQYQGGEQAKQPTLPSKDALSLRRTVAARLGELGADATRLAQASAILGDGCSLVVAADLAGLDTTVAVRQAARLEAASILRHGDPVEFVHPLIRRAVEAGLPEVHVGELHARAARLLWASGEPAGTVAQHLVVSPGAADPRVSEFLAEQGDEALEAGSNAAALRLLRRALDEPPPADQRGRILISLGRAELAQGELEAAASHLEDALDSSDRPIAVTATAELFDVLIAAGRFEELGPLHARAVAWGPYGDTEAEVKLKAQLLVNEFMAVDPELETLPPDLSSIDASTLPTERDVDRYLVVMAAVYERTAKGDAPERLAANLRRAVASMPADTDELTDWDVRTALAASTFLDQDLDEAQAMLDLVAPVVARLGGTAPQHQAELNHRRIMYDLAVGSFEAAQTGVDLAEQFTERHGLSGFDGHHRFVRGTIALQQGDYALAAEYLAERIGDENVLPALGALLAGRAQLALDILAPLSLRSEPMAEVRSIEVEMEPHLVASHAYQALGDRDRAVREAERELAIRRRYGSPALLALALRRRATFAPARESIRLLEEAVALADATPRRPLQARVLASYGTALQRAGRTQEARDVLYRAAALADEMGMRRVREHAQRALVVAGGRPRRERLTGPASLTSTQSEVAGLAAAGLTNREIAERMFVTIKTVETHLMAVYRKLGIRTRDELPPTLAADRVPAGAAAGGVDAP